MTSVSRRSSPRRGSPSATRGPAFRPTSCPASSTASNRSVSPPAAHTGVLGSASLLPGRSSSCTAGRLSPGAATTATVPSSRCVSRSAPSQRRAATSRKRSPGRDARSPRRAKRARVPATSVPPARCLVVGLPGTSAKGENHETLARNRRRVDAHRRLSRASRGARYAGPDAGSRPGRRGPSRAPGRGSGEADPLR